MPRKPLIVKTFHRNPELSCAASDRRGDSQ
jgi:hypothetical protein